MKAAQIIPATTPAKKDNPFFTKGGEHDFFHSSINEQPFFLKSKNNNYGIQTKLRIGAPNDVYEKEADSMADKVVQRLMQPEVISKKDQSVQSKPLSTSFTPFVQEKCAHCEEGEKLEKEKEHKGKERIQKKPIFESDGEPPDDEKKVQRKCAECEKEEKLQKKPNESSQAAPSNIESRLSSSKGGGSTLPAATREQMESFFGADFSSVRIHNDSSAAQMSRDLNAQAFTHGSDIYFNEGKYDANGTSGKHLLAHELTHVVQQGQYTNSVQRNTTVASSTLPPAPPYKVKGIEFDPTAKTLIIPNIYLPDFKRRNSAKYQLPIHALEGRPTTRQVSNWNEGVKSSVNAKVTVFLSSIQKPAGDRYFLKSKNTEYRLFGTKENIQAYSYIPEWNRKGMKNYHEVDHIVEMQLGGQDIMDNYELTDATANNSSGIEIQKERYNRVAEALTELKQANVPDLPKNDKVASRELVVMFNKVASWNLPYLGDGKMYWTRNEIQEGAHLKHLRGMTAKEIAKSQGTADELVLYVNERSGSPLRLPIPFTKVVTNWIPGIDVTACPPPDQNAMDNKKFGTLNIQLNKNFSNSLKSNASFPVSYNKTPGLLNTGYLTFTQDQRGIADLLRFEGLSPVIIEEFRLDEKLGIILHGKIHTNIPLIKDSDIDISVEGKNVMISKTFSSGEIKGLPNPLKVTDVSLMLFASTKFGFGVQGNVEFEIEKLGKGNVKGLGATREGFGVAGEFTFDSKKFERSKIGFEYKNQKWAINGTLQVAKGSIKGVKSGSLTIKYDSEKITANGEANLSVPGIDKVTLDAEFEKNGNFIINGGVDLKKLPGIKSGHVNISIASRKEESDIKLKVAGKASPDFPNVPGLNTELSVLYDDGLFEIRTKIQYQKGKFDGTIDLGVTNKSVDEKGQPQGDPNEGKELIVFGFGSLTVTLFKNIKGTVTVRFTPEKEVLVGGDIEIKDIKPFGEGYHPPDKELLKFPRITIPLIGLPGLSISAFIDGGVYFKFSWDPLVLKELKVGFKEININEIENATLDIHGEVGSMANAEVYLTIKAGLEGRALIATLSGSIGGEAGLGISAEAGGELDASWNKDKGLQFKEIRAYLNVTPRAVFRLTGDVSVDLDLWITTVNLYYHKWVFAEKQLDLGGLTLKADFPIKFDEENNLILPSLDQINLQKPDFTGSQGKDILDKAINGDSEQELEQKKQQIKAEIQNSLLKKYNEKDFSFSDYKDSMVEKYGKSPELKEFVLKTIEDESNRLEHERFEEEKSRIRSMPVPLANKISLVNIITMFNRYITEADRQAFINELISIEIEKQKEEQVKKDALVNGTSNVANTSSNSTVPSPDVVHGDKRIQRKPIFKNIGEPLHDLSNIRSNANSSSSFPLAEKGLSLSKKSDEVLPQDGSGRMNQNLHGHTLIPDSDNYFNPGKYDTNNNEGNRLLPYEPHSVQQNLSNKNNIHRQSSALIQKQGLPSATLPALTPEELLNFMLTQRGFGTSKPGIPTFDPKGVGKPTGKGYQTYAAIQIIDKEGKQIKVSTGAYLSGGDVHGEVDAINNLRNSLPPGTKLEGGKMMVAVEQLPCLNCDSSIKSFAKELGVSEYSIYIPQRESIRTPGTFIKPKTAATSAFQGERGPTTAKLLVSETLEDIPSSGSKVLSAEAKAAAKVAIATLDSDLKMLRIASFLKTSLAIIGGILDILNAVDFFNMTEKKLSSGAFILDGYLKEAVELDAKSDILNKEYSNISDKLSEMQLNFLKAIGGVPELGMLTLQVLDFKIQLQQMQSGLDERIKNISAIIKEANSKQAAAMRILEDPEASASIAMATFGTGELARLFAVSQDLQLISSRLSTALDKFKKVMVNIDEDVNFIQSWYDYFLMLCNGDPACKIAMNEGWYQIIVMSAKVPDSFWDTPDTYVSFPKNGLKTSVKDDTVNPVWNERVGLWRMNRLDDNITIEVYDQDPVTSDDLLASFDVKLKPSNPEGETFTLTNSSVSLVIRVERTLYEPGQ